MTLEREERRTRATQRVAALAARALAGSPPMPLTRRLAGAAVCPASGDAVWFPGAFLVTGLVTIGLLYIPGVHEEAPAPVEGWERLVAIWIAGGVLTAVAIAVSLGAWRAHALRRAERWLAGLPWPVAGYVEALGTQGLKTLAVRVETVEAPPPLVESLRALGPLQEVRHPERTVLLLVPRLGSYTDVNLARRAHRWFTALEATVLRPLHEQAELAGVVVVGRGDSKAAAVLAELDGLDPHVELHDVGSPPEAPRPVFVAVLARWGPLGAALRLIDRLASNAEAELVPSDEQPGDRWLRRHATVRTRRLMARVGLGCVFATLAAVPAVGIPYDAYDWWSWPLVAGIAGAQAAALAIAAALHLVDRAGAVAREEAFARGLPFDGRAYLDFLRAPPGRAKRGFVAYDPRLTAVMGPPAPGDRALEERMKLVPSTSLSVRPVEGTRKTKVVELRGGQTLEPWAWCRQVIEDVLVPLAAVHPVSNLSIDAKHTAVTPSE